MEPSSPHWQRPDDVMRLRRLKQKKKALQARLTGLLRSTSATELETVPEIVPAKVFRKRKANPFGVSSHSTNNKKTCQEAISELDVSTDGTIFQLLTASYSDKCVSGDLVTSFADAFLHYGATAEGLVKGESSKKEETAWEKELPVDWSLKTRLRLTSSVPFAWNAVLKASEEVSGVTSFVRCLPPDSNSASLDTSAGAQFHRCRLYWQHPSLPWVKLFPRYRSNFDKGRNLGSGAWCGEDIQKTLLREWKESLYSLYQLLRTRQCPFFYLCSNSFTCLFRAAGISAASEMNAMVAPTTRGLRQAFRQEGIEFVMPLQRDAKENFSGCTSREERQLSGDEEEEEMEEKEEASDWLASIGVEANSLPGLSTRAKLKKEGVLKDDWRAESMVQVNGCETQALLNFLLNSRRCISITGPTAGVPPTLLAPVAFKGATLKELQRPKHAVITVSNAQRCSMSALEKDSNFGGFRTLDFRIKDSQPVFLWQIHMNTVLQPPNPSHVLELVGPILPHIPNLLLQSLSKTSSASGSCAATILEGTQAFSYLPSEASGGEETFGLVSLSDCGLGQEDILPRFCSRDTKCDKEVREIEFQGDLFRWR